MNKTSKIFLVLFTAFLGVLFSQASLAAWNDDWAHRVKISLNTAEDGVATTGPLDTVPVLVRLHTGNFSFVDASETGADLRFIAGDDKTPLKYHIEKFDGLNELALIWVQVPKLIPASKGEYIWLYYGNPEAIAGDEVKATYDTAQALVLHFGEKEGLPKDATAYGNNVTESNATINNNGLIGGAVTLDGSRRMTVAASPSLQLGANGMTVSMWVKPSDATQNSTLFRFGEGANALTLSLRADKLVAQLGTAVTAPGGTLTTAAWHHVALTVKDGITLYLDGVEVGKAAASTAANALSGAAVIGEGYKGDLDEFQIATVARSPEWIKLAASSQGQDQKLVAYGQAEGEGEGGEVNYVSILLGAVTLDGWIVIGILMLMMVVSVAVMIGKTMFLNRTVAANARFKEQFAALIQDLTALDDDQAKSKAAVDPTHADSSLYRMYHVGVIELRHRIEAYRAKGRDLILTAQSMDAIRASLDACYVRETQRLNSQMVLLTISIAGGPFLGLLGTVVGVMITFAAIAAAGDVNVNAIAPGIAAALVATVAGLAVAIPALFGYNYFATKIGEIGSDMQVFVDEFITKVAENYSV